MNETKAIINNKLKFLKRFICISFRFYYPFNDPTIIPDWKFFLTNGKNINTGTTDIIIAASDIVFEVIFSIIVGGSPSVNVEV